MATAPQKTNPAVTVLTITVGFAVIYLVSDAAWSLYVAVSVGLLGLISSYLRNKIDFLWMKMAQVLSYIMPNILLTLIYFLILFPVSLLAKAFQRNDPLRLKRGAESVFQNRDKQFGKEDFEKMW